MTHQTTQSHIPEDASLHLTLVRGHRMCGGLASHLAYTRCNVGTQESNRAMAVAKYDRPLALEWF